MKLISYKTETVPEAVGVLKADGTILPVSVMDMPYETMTELIRNITPAEIEDLRVTSGQETPGTIPMEEVTLLAPIPHPAQDILCLGLNYQAHAAEAKQYNDVFVAEKAQAIYFSKRCNEALPHNGVISDFADLTKRLDYEVELAVILGKDAKNVAPENVKDYIFGYTIFNDMSARDLQTSHKQWYFGKSLDGFCPMGPYIETADAIAYPPALDITSYVNGELRQSGNTSEFIHSIDEIVSELSQGMTLLAGTIIATGTPKGVAMGMDNPEFLRKGDTVTCCIEGLGELTSVIG